MVTITVEDDNKKIVFENCRNLNIGEFAPDPNSGGFGDRVITFQTSETAFSPKAEVGEVWKTPGKEAYIKASPGNHWVFVGTVTDGRLDPDASDAEKALEYLPYGSVRWPSLW